MSASALVNARFDEIAQRGSQRLIETLFELLPSLNWDRAALHRHRSAALSQTLSFAVERSPWHSIRLAGVDLSAVTPDDLTAIPPMSKSELMDNWDQIVTDPGLDLATAREHLREVDADGPAFFGDEYLIFTTGGTTGEPGVFPWAMDEFARWGVSGVRAGTDAGFAPPQRLAHVGARSPRHPSSIVPLLLYGTERGRDLVIPVDQPVDEIVVGLNRAQPDAVWAVSSILPALVRAAADGSLRIDVERISVGGDSLDPAAADAAEEVFGVRPTETYPTTDLGYIAQQVPGERSMMVNDDLLIVEPVDEREQPVPPGELSHHLLVTSLHQRTLPLIRYRIDDRVRFDREPGRYAAYSRIARIDGRSDDLFDYDGRVVHPHTFRTVISRYPEIIDYEVHQTREGADVRVAVKDGLTCDDAALGRDVGERLASAGLPGAVVRVEVVDALARSAVGKRRLFHPLRR